MMRLFPAVDIQHGQCVRLRRGDFADETVFSHDPLEVARHWVGQGARFLHVVDLDGAREGEPRNLAIAETIARAVLVPMQYGGGVRSDDALQQVREAGIARVMIGTSAITDEEFLIRALRLWPVGLVVAVDAEDGYVRTHGWRQKSGFTAVTLVRQLGEMGVREILYTDISRDGMMDGVNVAAVEALARETREVRLSGRPPLEIIAAGGVTSLGDLRALKKLEPLGVTGVIAGRALYEHAFTLAEALEVLDA
jgi:phosphoribosylformimino-5-aminoimidazole carboxamide ribotide isomerase